jgi:HlyD family secretion protein
MGETGQPVEIVSNAIGQTLTGVVSQIGPVVGRQDLVSSDTAADTDARVIEV